MFDVDRDVLSGRGCGRATHYLGANKIVDAGEETHVAWLDSDEDGFRAKVRSRGPDGWSPTHTLGGAEDNHGGPALVTDHRGHLHAAYGPHHGPMRYRRSTAPGDGSDWTPEVRFGENLTYPTMVSGPDGTLFLLARQSRDDAPWRVLLFTRPPGGPWGDPTVLFENERHGYVRFQKHLAWGPNGRLHAEIDAGHDTEDGNDRICYLYTDDGDDWRRADGASVDLPATPETATTIVREPGTWPICHNLAVDDAGDPHCVHGNFEHDRLTLSRLAGDTWEPVRELQGDFPEAASGWHPYSFGIVFAGDGRVYVPVVAAPSREEFFGDPASEAFVLVGDDVDGPFGSVLLDTIEPERPHWGISHERPTGHNPVGSPRFLYTRGERGDTLDALLANDVVFATLDSTGASGQE